MTFNYEALRKVKINMDGFIKDLLDTCQDIVGVSAIPGDPKLFHVANESNIHYYLITYVNSSILL
jgi:hypothetical protein